MEGIKRFREVTEVFLLIIVVINVNCILEFLLIIVLEILINIL